MGPMPFMIRNDQKKILLTVARDSISHALDQHQPLPIQLHAYPHELHANRACFVTLHRGEDLRGCIGSLAAHRPLVIDISENAYAAAFRDPRFPPLSHQEFRENLMISISVLSLPEPVSFQSEADLLTQLRPGLPPCRLGIPSRSPRVFTASKGQGRLRV